MSEAEEATRYSCLYFGYASNLSPRTLKQRCPESAYAGLAILKDYRWQISGTGYANIVPSPGDEVYGALAFLSPRDENALDQSEGVPYMYEKHDVTVTRIDSQSQPLYNRTTGEIQTVRATTYIDVKRTTDGPIMQDYLIWCNRAIADATPEGLPQSYVEKYLRPFVPIRVEQDHERKTNMLVGGSAVVQCIC